MNKSFGNIKKGQNSWFYFLSLEDTVTWEENNKIKEENIFT